MTFRQRLEEIARQKTEIQRQEAKLEAARNAALASLPTRHGFHDVDDFIRALRVATGETGTQHRGAKGAKIPLQGHTPAGLARAKAQQEPASSASLPTPGGTSLDDPANFGQMPDFSLLTSGQSITPEERARLTESLAFANRVLHTSRVPAMVWREWRRFEKEAAELLRL